MFVPLTSTALSCASATASACTRNRWGVVAVTMLHDQRFERLLFISWLIYLDCFQTIVALQDSDHSGASSLLQFLQQCDLKESPSILHTKFENEGDGSLADLQTLQQQAENESQLVLILKQSFGVKAMDASLIAFKLRRIGSS